MFMLLYVYIAWVSKKVYHFFLASNLYVFCLFPLQSGSSLTDQLKEKQLEFDTSFEKCFGLGNKVFIVW